MSAIRWSNTLRGVGLGATGFCTGAGLPWACFAALGVLAGLLVALVSGITRIPHVSERMLSVYSIRFGLLVWGRFSWVRLFPDGADIALHPACTFVFRPVHQHGWGLKQPTFKCTALALSQPPCGLAPLAWKPTNHHFAFGSIHKPLVKACGVCCLHSSSVSMKFGTQTQNAMNAINIVPMIIF